MTKLKSTGRMTAIGGTTSPSNGAENGIAIQRPYRVEVKIKGVAPILFHAWNCESVESKSNAKKGSKEKKTDDVESYIYRNEKKEVCIPGEYLRGAIIKAAKFQQDPRSPRKSAADLFKAAVSSLTMLASLGAKDWDYLDKRRAVIQRNSITRIRPAFREGWQATFVLMVNLPEYVSPELLNETIQMAGRVGGLGDFIPTFGRFQVVSFKLLDE